MRRRQAFALAGRSPESHVGWLKEVGKPSDSLIGGEIGVVEGFKWTSAQKTGTPKGVCPKCGKHIGKGIYAHKKACK